MIEIHRWGVSRIADRIWSHVADRRPSVRERVEYVALQAFIDDSGQPGGCFVLAGCMASAEQWAAFTSEWEALLQSHGTLSGRPCSRYHFKMAEMLATPERASRIPAFADTIYRHIRCEFGVGMRLQDFQEVFRRVVPDPQVKISPKVTEFHLVFCDDGNHVHFHRTEQAGSNLPTRGIVLRQVQRGPARPHQLVWLYVLISAEN
jgi:hypothetical protein